MISQLRFYYSVQHFQSAMLFRDISKEIEDDLSSKECSREDLVKHRAYVTSAIFSIVAFLEATINELYSDNADADFTSIVMLDEETKEIMKKLWELRIPRTASYSILDKYQIALAISKKELFEKGCFPYQDVNLLVSLRNALIHFEPETLNQLSYNSLEKSKLEKKLNGKFELCKLQTKHLAFFPDRFLSYGCTDWAIDASFNLVDNFFNRLGFTPALFKQFKKFFE